MELILLKDLVPLNCRSNPELSATQVVIMSAITPKQNLNIHGGYFTCFMPWQM